VASLPGATEKVEKASWWWEWTTGFTVAYDWIKDLPSSYREYNESTSDA